MATPVPYSGAPQVAPEDRPVPYTQLNVPGGAFGLGKAQATEQLGGAFQQAGGEIYARAVAMQELNEQAKANEAVAANEREQMTKFIDFKTNSIGKDAVDGLPGFMSGADTTRQQIRGTLKSPYAQRLYDNESRNATNRIIFSAGIHASEQGKLYAQDSAKAGIVSAQNSININPADEANFQGGLGDIEKRARDYAKTKPWDAAATDNFVKQQKETAAITRVDGLIKPNTPMAKTLMDKYVNDGLITSSEGGKLADKIQRELYTSGARKLSGTVMSGQDSQFGTGIVAPERARDAIKSVEGSGNYNPPHPTITNPKSQYYGQHALGAYGIMQGNLLPWLKEAGMEPMSEDAFVKDRDAQDKLFDFKFGQYMQQTGSFNGARKLWFGTGASDGYTTQDQYQAKTDTALARSASRSDVDTVSRRAADKAIPGDGGFADAVSQHSEMQWGRNNQIELDTQRRYASTVAAAVSLPGPDGKLAQSEQDLYADPKVGAAYDNMDESQRTKVRAILQNNINKGGYAFTPQSRADYMNFVGAYNNPNRSPEDNDMLLNQDIMSKHWPAAEKKQALVMYGKLLDHEAADPQMAHPLQVLDPLMSAADIDSKRDSTGHHKDEYNQFVGALHGVISDYVKENGRKPKDDEIKAMGSRLVQDLTKYRRSIFQPVQKFYQMDIPQDVQDDTKEAYRKAYNTEPTDVEVHSIAVAKMYQSIYGRKPKAAP